MIRSLKRTSLGRLKNLSVQLLQQLAEKRKKLKPKENFSEGQVIEM